MARYRGLTLRVLGARNPAMGPGKAELIARIGETGSISADGQRAIADYKINGEQLFFPNAGS